MSPRLSAQDRSGQSEILAHTMDSATNARSFPFFKLPAELRNQIYRLVVVTGRSLVIHDMHHEELERGKNNGTYQSRSTYLATDHVCDLKPWPVPLPSPTVQPCLFKDIGLKPMNTTYKLGTPHSVDTTTTTMLSLNKQSREEVAFIFYGENTFHFTTMSSLVPFMKDRTAETRKYIQQLWLTLTIDDRDWEAIFTEHGRPATWNTAFSALMKLPHVNVKKLCVQVDDRKGKLLTDGMNLRSRSMLWLHKLGKFENLDMLGVRYDVGDWNFLQRQLVLRRCSVLMGKGTKTQTEEELWRFLAPKTLRKEADDHSPDALRKRRIWDFSQP
ncbi:MAG: hypothetical protein Q9175_002866 [Cornicularia normoerica]